MKRQLVTFPSGGEWEDSGEGGLYAILAVPEPVEWANNCVVDVYTSIQYNRPKDAARSTTVRMGPHDVCVSSEVSASLWSPYDYKSITRQMDAAKTLRGKGMAAEARWVDQANHQDDFSRSMLATVFLGSTSQSLWSERQGRYFEATRDDLTIGGLTLFQLFESAYGVEPVILTFLDT